MTRSWPGVAAALVLVVVVLLPATAAGQAAPDTLVQAPVGPGPPTDTLLPPPATGGGAPVPPVDVERRQVVLRDFAAELDTPLSGRLVSLLGIVALLVIGWLLSVDRRVIPWRIIAWGLGLQLGFALLILKTTAGHRVFDAVNEAFVALLGFMQQGASFLFGALVGGPPTLPVGTMDPSGAFIQTPGMVAQHGAYFAFTVLPTIVFFASLMAVLYHLGVMQLVVRGFAWIMVRTMRTSGAETLSAAGNIFVGQTEAPLLVKPFVGRMTQSELMAVMTGGFATVAGGVMAAYVGFLIAFFPDVAGHLLAASVMSAPAALVFAKLMYPEREVPETAGAVTQAAGDTPAANVIDAAARGAGEGLTLAFNVGAMLLAFIALLALLNALIGWFGAFTGLTSVLQGVDLVPDGAALSLQIILGWLFAPLAWLMGVPWQDATTIGGLLGVKTAANEFVAYIGLMGLLQGEAELTPRSVVIATYALCGFANFSSIAIQIGGLGGIAPERRSDLARLGLRAMVAGTLAAFMTATIAGLIL
jgi:concentrative nucleoside transporter, CNT family